MGIGIDIASIYSGHARTLIVLGLLATFLFFLFCRILDARRRSAKPAEASNSLAKKTGNAENGKDYSRVRGFHGIRRGDQFAFGVERPVFMRPLRRVCGNHRIFQTRIAEHFRRKSRPKFHHHAEVAAKPVGLSPDNPFASLGEGNFAGNVSA